MFPWRVEVTCDGDQESTSSRTPSIDSNMQLSFADIEEWLDTHPEKMADYFLTKADISLVNRWLVLHGFLSIKDYVSSRRNSATTNISGDSSPIEKSCEFFSDSPDAFNCSKSVSKKHLRQDYALSKKMNVFRTCDTPGHGSDVSSIQSRRNSLKDMRKCLSLPSRSIYILNMLIQSKVEIPRFPSKGRDSKRELRLSNERQYFLESVQEIAHDLDVKSLTQKITVNLSVLVDSDGASLFLIQGPKSHRILVSKVFDLHTGTDIIVPSPTDDNEVRVPWGTGIMGHVAESGDIMNLTNASEHPKYNDEVDKICGYRIETLLCMPVRNADNDIIAVAQIFNKNSESGKGVFSPEDEKLAKMYLEFCGIALTNAYLFELSQKEYERNRSLLEVVHDLFEEQTSLDKVILKIMQRAQRLLNCERVALLLLQEGTYSEIVKFSRTFDLASPLAGSSTTNTHSWPELRTSSGLLQVAERVVCTGEVLNLTDPPEIQQDGGRHIWSLLSMPIRNRDYRIIGVAIIINGTDGTSFDENDEQLFEAFTLFCGLGINNALMYGELEKAIARQKVAIEVISYHGTSPRKEVQKFMETKIPATDEWQLENLKFDDFSLSSDEMLLASIKMFQNLGLISKFRIDYQSLCQFLCTMRKNYRNVPYHNWRHAFNVAQVMFAILTHCGMKSILTDLEIFGMFTGCLCHDLDHRGTNNAFQEKSGSALALLYGSKATMEQHHFNHAVMILSSKGHNIFSSLSATDYSRVMKILKQAILATDLSTYFQLRGKFFSLVDNAEYNWDVEDQREALRSLLMTACDLGASTKPWHIQKRVAELVTNEFFDQGDKEKTQLRIQPPALMDREKKNELPRLQYDWIDSICLPLYRCLAKINERFIEMVEGAVSNQVKWEDLSGQNLCIDKSEDSYGGARVSTEDFDSQTEQL
ncbi:dual 3',5'-cyclic-AMP and -GMP phosphodiesterase 11A-like isoform X1 [Tachypleus tridentatus]|uniref:dual 3',5'-cyclic-AMP and -GMP phosphodiesterase 11A-like isoform X1 n=2 Tax=Tachypleus tridentatus TaxID=6853 RepID=UPI003FD67915